MILRSGALRKVAQLGCRGLGVLCWIPCLQCLVFLEFVLGDDVFWWVYLQGCF